MLPGFDHAPKRHDVGIAECGLVTVDRSVSMSLRARGLDTPFLPARPWSTCHTWPEGAPAYTMPSFSRPVLASSRSDRTLRAGDHGRGEGGEAHAYGDGSQFLIATQTAQSGGEGDFRPSHSPAIVCDSLITFAECIEDKPLSA